MQYMSHEEIFVCKNQRVEMLPLFFPHVASYSDASGYNLLVFCEQLFLCGVIERLFWHVLCAIIGPSHIMRMNV
jgi:hypothetical protein